MKYKIKSFMLGVKEARRVLCNTVQVGPPEERMIWVENSPMGL